MTERLTYLVLLALSLTGVAFYLDHKTPAEAPHSRPAEPDKPKAPKAKIALYLFTASWCGPCQALHVQMKDPAVKKALERFDLVETEDQDQMRAYGVTGFPTFVAITASGQEKLVGYQDAAALAEWLNSL